MRKKLTDATVAAIKPPKVGQEEYFDTTKDTPSGFGSPSGFGLRVSCGGRKAWSIVGRLNKKAVRFTLGEYPSMTLLEARKRAREFRGKIVDGIDPRVATAAADADNTFGNSAERFINEYAKGKKKPLRDKTVKGYEWALTGEITPTAEWKDWPLASITDRHIIKAVDHYETEKQFASARLLHAYLRRFFRWAVEKRLIDNNPARGIPLASTPSDFKRDRVLPIDELRKVLAGAAKLKNDTHRAYIHSLVLTAQRERETALMKWSDLTLEGPAPSWFIPGANAKNHRDHVVPLVPQTLEILSGLPRLGEFVFTTNGKTPISGFSKIKKQVDQNIEAAEAKDKKRMKPWRIHDLRRSAATGMGQLGFAPHVIEAAANHVSGTKAGMSGLYNKSGYEDDVRRALTAWAEQVAPSGQGGNVVRMRAGQGIE